MNALADDFALCADPVVLARRAGLEPDDWQAAALRSRAPRLLLNVTRQGGKSVTTACLGVHTALFQTEALVLFLSPSERQSAELFRKALQIYHAAGAPVPALVENKLSLELRNGSRIISLPGSEGSIRGYSKVTVLAIDEASRVPDALIYSTRPMLATSGPRARLVLMSTPYARAGAFFQAWEHGGTSWERYKVPATDCPRIPPDFLDEERQAMGDLWYSREYCCQFVEIQGQLIGDAFLDASLLDFLPGFALPDLAGVQPARAAAPDWAFDADTAAWSAPQAVPETPEQRERREMAEGILL